MAGPIQWITTRGSLRGLARWLFLITLVTAPWLYGGTAAWAIELINGKLGLVFEFLVAAKEGDRRRLDRIARPGAKGHWRTNDFLAAAPRPGGFQHIFRDLLLPRQRRRLSQSGASARGRSRCVDDYAQIIFRSRNLGSAASRDRGRHRFEHVSDVAGNRGAFDRGHRGRRPPPSERALAASGQENV